MPAFATGADLTVRYDWRWIGNNITDSGTPANESQVINSPIIAILIAEASEDVMAAAAVGNRYTVQDLQQYGGLLLTGIVCALVMGKILKRRARAAKDEEALTLSYTEALGYLEQMRRGERIFYSVPDVAEAGVPHTANMAPPLGFGQPLITDEVRFFGTVGFDRNYGYYGS